MSPSICSRPELCLPRGGGAESGLPPFVLLANASSLLDSPGVAAPTALAVPECLQHPDWPPPALPPARPALARQERPPRSRTAAVAGDGMAHQNRTGAMKGTAIINA